MAKRSDFAQKLLDDLRLRKERLAVSQNSTHSRTQSRDYGYSKQTFGGSAGNGKAAIRTSNMESKSVGRQRTVSSREQSSNQIVPFQKTSQGSQQIGDFSMALAFALQNGGKLKQVDSSMLTFLHQIGGGAVDFTKMTRNTAHGSTSRVPTLTHLHIKEISRGAQKLNQILNACSNGLNFDQYSIKIGNELLKGAMDLQDSLRMLVELQEASDVMVTPQRKNRIVLLEDGEEDENVEQKLQLDLPRFSFDKPRRYLQLQSSVKSLNSTSHVRSVSYGDGLKHSNVSGSSQPKSEKGRISNVIAKLMGLEEVREEDKIVKSRSGKKDDKNLATLTIVSEFPVKRSVTKEANVHSKSMWKSPEKIDQRIHHQEKEKRNDRVKPPDGKRTQEKVFQQGNRVKQTTNVELEKSYAMQKNNVVDERKKQTHRQKKGSDMASKTLSKPHNATVVVHRKHLPVTEKLNRYTDAKVVPTKSKGSKKLHGTMVVVNSASRSVSPQEIKKVTQQEKKSQATGNTVAKSLKSIRNDDLYGSGGEQCMTKDVKSYVADSVETKNANMKLLGNVVKEATTNGFVTAAHKLNKDVVLSQDMDGRKILPSDESGRERKSSAESNDSHSQLTAFGRENEPEHAKVVHIIGTVSKNATDDFQPSKIQDQLTEFERRFKCILLESRLFVETAQALFKLDIIAEIPNFSTQYLHEGENKLVLDCGYEIMKRKGRLQEQAYHPFMSMHFSLMKIVSFDDLVKKLTSDFEKLKHYGRNGTVNCEVEDYLPRMLECDIHVRDPEINSMWDSGWNDQMFAFIEKDEVVKDVERQLLVGLIEEATRDFLHV